MIQLPTQEELVKKAEKVMSLAKNMDEAFDAEFTKEHLKLAIVAGLGDKVK